MLCKLLGVSGDDLLETGRASRHSSSNHGGTSLNLIKIAGRNGSYEERILTDEQVTALKAILDQMPDASGDL